MMKYSFIAVILCFLWSITSASAQLYNTDALKNIQADKEYDNIYVKKIEEDENASVFIIWVKNAVRLHKHENHSEQIVVLEGKAEMRLGDQLITIKKGDFIHIPENTAHEVTKVYGKKALKVISIQCPIFKGKDRVFLD